MNKLCLPRPTDPFFRFLAVGAINTAVGLSITFLLLNFLNFSYWTSTFAGNTAGACVSFFLNKSFTFRSNVPVGKGALRFTVIILICYYTAYSASKALASFLPFIPIHLEGEAGVLMGTVLYTLLNYAGQKYIVFPDRAAVSR